MKRKYLLPLLFATAGTSAFAQQKAPAIVQGSFNKKQASSVMLYEVNYGEREEFARTKLSGENKSFAFQVPAAKSGYYYLSADPKRGGIRIWLAPGVKLQLQVQDSGYSIINPSAENKALMEWENMRAPLRAMSRSMLNDNPRYRSLADTSTYRSFFPMLQAFLPKAAAFRKKINTGNKTFNELLRFTIDADLQAMGMQFLLQPRSAHPKKEDYPSFYQSIAQSDILNTTRIYQLGEGNEFINTFPTFRMLMGDKMPERDRMQEWILQQIPNDTLKGDLVANNLSRSNSFEEVLEKVNKYGQYLVTPPQLAIKDQVFEKLVKYQKGAPGYNFDLVDINEKKVSLKSLAGKVVVVDVWATWCGPCKAEIPHLKKLTEEMQGKEVVFVSISTDKEADKDKWKKFVADQQLDGVQLYDPSGKSVITYYKIPGIPRFMVFDKAGNIVTVDAPRPSTPDLKKMIEQYL